MIKGFIAAAALAAGALVSASAASALPVDTTVSVGAAGVENVAVVCNRWGNCVRRPVYRPRVYVAPPVFVAPAYVAPRVYVAPRRAYVAPRRAWNNRCGWRNGRRVCW
jgi:hypothetical protein